MPHQIKSVACVEPTSNEREAANRAEVTALLIRAGYRVYRPEADCYGEDLVVRDPASGELWPVQLKSRPTVDKKYGGLRIWMLFPDPAKSPADGRDWFLVPHSQLFDWVKMRHGHTDGWKDVWHYPVISADLRSFLEPFSHRCWPGSSVRLV